MNAALSTVINKTGCCAVFHSRVATLHTAARAPPVTYSSIELTVGGGGVNVMALKWWPHLEPVTPGNSSKRASPWVPGAQPQYLGGNAPPRSLAPGHSLAERCHAIGPACDAKSQHA